tara:strand:- start:352 stop:951 length:600 start_codon:yes stop_codon:yes gene_type:complete
MKINMYLKKTIKEDNELYYLLRNDNKDINKSDHSKWFNKNFKSNYFFTCFYASKKIGYLSGEENNGVINISMAIKKEYQQKDLASKFYKIYETKLKSNSILVSHVHKSDKTSIDFFLKNDYELLKKQKNLLLFYKIYNLKIKRYLKAITDIENVRRNNNINWMNILRVAFKNSPTKASLIFKNIFKDDQKISSLSKKLF